MVFSGIKAISAERHWRPQQCKRHVWWDLFGIKAISAERHWRPSANCDGFCGVHVGIKAISAERHWRPTVGGGEEALVFVASKPSQPKGIGDWAS